MRKNSKSMRYIIFGVVILVNYLFKNDFGNSYFTIFIVIGALFTFMSIGKNKRRDKDIDDSESYSYSNRVHKTEEVVICDYCGAKNNTQDLMCKECNGLLK